MKKLALPGLIIMSLLTSCEKPVELTDPQVFLKIGDEYVFRFEDIALYDSSTHIIYLKNAQSGFDELLEGKFTFFDMGDTLYSGSIVPGYSSSIPTGPFIYSPLHIYGNYALRILLWSGTDVRNSQRFIEVLKTHNLLHSGLTGVVDFAEITDSYLTFRFTITNHDISNLRILDINKTGPELFHYFTNGVYLRGQDNREVLSSIIDHQQPDPWDSWQPEWLSTLNSGESMSFTINYPVDTPISPGEYNLTFEFPGLAYQVSREELIQGTDRIWLGDIKLKSKITIP
jgi:hypothetical protein